MRMHRGSSKGPRDRSRGSESLPLSASPSPPEIELTIEITRAGTVDRRTLTVPKGALIRSVLKQLGEAPEGCAVLIGDVPQPLDTPLEGSSTLTVLPTFSGG